MISTISNMRTPQDGLVSPLLVTAIVLGVLVLGLGGFSFWAYSEYQSYKNDVDPKIAAACLLYTSPSPRDS